MLDKRHDKNENFIRETVLYCMANEAHTLPTVQNYTINISDFGLMHVFFSISKRPANMQPSNHDPFG